MTAASSTPGDTRRRGWCPGALRPMQSGDGLLVRIKPSCGILSLDQAAAVAKLAAAYGNGMIELTSRGNLQLRGVRDDTLAPLTAALDRLGLLDASREAEAVRNVIGAPLAGIDATAFDTRPLVRSLEARLRDDADLHALSDKFLFVINGGGALPLDDVEADIGFAWRGDAFAIGLGREAGPTWLGTCAADEVVSIAIGLAQAYLAHAGGARRMRLLDDVVLAQVAAAIPPLRPSDIPSPRPYEERARVRGSRPATPDVGTAAIAPSAVAIGLPYGATTAAALTALLREAFHAGVGEARLTPRRTVILPVPDAQRAAALIAAAASLGFVTAADDSRLSVAACPGAPACASASTPVRADADRFVAATAALLAAGATLHVSGCTKGCARRRPATITVVGAAGAYGLVVNDAAAAVRATRYTGQQAAETLARLASAVTKAGDRRELCSAAEIQAALEEIEAA